MLVTPAVWPSAEGQYGSAPSLTHGRPGEGGWGAPTPHTLEDLEDSGVGNIQEKTCLRIGCVGKGLAACVLESSPGGGRLHAEVTPNSGISLPSPSKNLSHGRASVKVTSTSVAFKGLHLARTLGRPRDMAIHSLLTSALTQPLHMTPHTPYTQSLHVTPCTSAYMQSLACDSIYTCTRTHTP